jgi:hypothetical protein
MKNVIEKLGGQKNLLISGASIFGAAVSLVVFGGGDYGHTH